MNIRLNADFVCGKEVIPSGTIGNIFRDRVSFPREVVKGLAEGEMAIYDISILDTACYSIVK